VGKEIREGDEGEREKEGERRQKERERERERRRGEEGQERRRENRMGVTALTNKVLITSSDPSSSHACPELVNVGRTLTNT
jgi:hypothetical protein